MSRPSARRRRLRLALLAAGACGLLPALAACVQPTAVFTPFAVVDVRIVHPPYRGVAGVRVSLTGTRPTATGSGATAGDNDFAFTDVDGRALIRTQKTGRHFVVARHQDYDITYGGDSSTVTAPGPIDLTAFLRGRIDVRRPDETFTPDFLFPFSGFPDSFIRPLQRSPRKLELPQKSRGRAFFVAFAEDFNILRNSLLPTAVPQPVGRVLICGDFNGFITSESDTISPPLELFDDGSTQPFNEAGDISGDYQAGDGAFSRILGLSSGEHTYMFLPNGVPVYTRDPYEEKSKRIRVALPRNPVNNVQEVLETTASVILVP